MDLRTRIFALLAALGLAVAACSNGEAEPTTTTAAATFDTPPESGLYIVEEEHYATGRIVFPRDLQTPGGFEDQLPAGIPWGIAFTLPAGAELRSPFDACLTVFRDEATGERAITLVTPDDRIQVEIVGHLEPAREPAPEDSCTLADGQVWQQALWVARASLIASMEGDGRTVYGAPANLLIGFFDPGAGFSSDLDTLVSFFSYVPELGARDVPEEDLRAVLELWSGLSDSWSGGVDAFARYLVDNNYPLYGFSIEQCAAGYQDVEEGFALSFEVIEWTVGHNDTWTLPENAPGAGTTPDGRLYGMAVRVTSTEPGLPQQTALVSAHTTITDDGAFFFIVCR